jgi:hypothetical protein
MPEPIYVCGFLKAYANYLGLDGDRFAAHISFWHERRRRTRRAAPIGGIRSFYGGLLADLGFRALYVGQLLSMG